MIGQILIGLVGVILGFIMVWKSEWFLEMVGEQQWAEKFFGTGNSNLAYKAIGIIIIILSFLIMTGLIKGVMMSVARLFGAK